MTNKFFKALTQLGATDTFVAYAPQVEGFLPQSEDVEKAVVELMI